MKVLAFGEILYDVIEGKPYLGGAPLNFAAHVAQCGGQSAILSRVGDDALGTQALEQIAQLGVETAFISKDRTHPTGTVDVRLENGQPDYTIHEQVAYDFITVPGDVLADDDFAVLYFGTLAQRSPQSRATLQEILAGKKYQHVFYDVNLRKESFNQEIIEESLRLCSILKLNDGEVVELGKMLFGEELAVPAFCQKVETDFGIAVMVVTLGAEGCQIHEHGQLHTIPGYPATVADTVGAGDAFSAAFVYKYLNGASAPAAGDAANRLGAFVASHHGPIPTYSAEIREALAKK